MIDMSLSFDSPTVCSHHSGPLSKRLLAITERATPSNPSYDGMAGLSREESPRLKKIGSNKSHGLSDTTLGADFVVLRYFNQLCSPSQIDAIPRFFGCRPVVFIIIALYFI